LWAFVAHPSWGRFVIVQVAAIVAAQTHYANCVLVAALVGGAAAVALRRRSGRLLGALAALGMGAALSLLINLRDLVYITSTAPLGTGSWSLGWLLQVFAAAFAPGVRGLGVCWLMAAVLALAGFAAAWRAGSAPQRERTLFFVVTLPPALAGLFAGFLRAGVPTNYWHYLSLLAVIVLACEVGVWLLARQWRHGELVRIGAAALAALVVAPGVVQTVPLRMTSLDVVARTLEEKARPDDLVVVFPWPCGITFARYYRGAAPWITWPDLPEHRVHTHLEIAEKMKLGDAAVRPELERVERTLRAGATVWIVGQPSAPDAGHPLPPLPPAPHGPRGWSSAPYLDHWELQLGALLETHAARGSRVPLPDLGRVNAWENPPLFRVEGWR
jgi:hypothetical protein